MSVEYTKKTWYDGSEGGTPITAAELNRVETGIDDVVTQSNADKTNIDTHLAKKINSSDGAHGLRYYNSELDYYDDTNEEWVEIQTGGGGTTDYEDLLNKPSINGVELLGNKTIGLLSGNIQIGSDKIGYDNSDSDLSATNTKSAIDELASTRAIKTLSNIQNTTTTDVECRYSNTGKEFIADDWNFVNGKYINIKSENNVIYAVVSEDGYTVTNKVATNLPSDVGYVFQNPNSNVYFAICVVSGAKVSIFYSSNLATWTKVILPNSEGTEPEQGIYKYKMNYVSKPISYTLWGDTCIVIALGYRQYEDSEGIMQTDYTSIITARNGNDFAIANSNLGSFNENLDTSVFYQYYNTPNYHFVLSSYTSTDGLTYTKYTLPDDRSPQYVTKVGANYQIWGTDYTNHTCAVFSTSDFTTFTKVYDFYPSTWQEHPEFSDYFDEVNRVLFKNDTYFVLGSNYDSEHDVYKAAIVAIPSTFTNREWCDLPNGEYNFNPDRSKATVYDYTNGTEYNLLNISPFTAEVSKALTILDVGSGGGSGTDDYEDLLNKPSINGVELLGSKAIGTLSGDIQVEYADLLNKPSINGVELLGNKLVGLLSTDIHINADKIGYNGTVSGASTTKAAIDALQSSLSGLHGIPSGGNTNQVLAKNSSSDYDLKWVNQTGGGGVGTVINLTTLYSALFNQTVTLTGTYDTYTTTFDSTGHATVNVFYVDTYAVTCQGSTDSVTVTAIGLVINADVFSVAVVNLTTPYSALFNQTVTLTGTNATYTSSFDASGHASVTVLYTDTYTVTCQSLTDSVTVSSLGTVVNATVFDITAVTLSSSDSQLVGATCTVYKGNPTDADVRMTTTLDSTLSFTFQTNETGSYTLTTTYSGVTIPTTFTVSSIGTTMSVAIQSVPLKTWTTATESEVVAMVDAADKGYIDLYNDCGWRVGQERTVHLSAMSATGVGENHVAQDVSFVLMNVGGKTLTNAVASGRTECSFVTGLKECLIEGGYMNSTATNVGGWTSCARRTWCNNVFKGAMPNTLLPIFKQFQNKTSAGSQSSTINTDNDWFSMPAEIELFGTTTYSYSGEGSRFTWYETDANRVMVVGGVVQGWWQRSPCNVGNQYFCYTGGTGGNQPAYHNANISSFGLAPYGVI